MAKLHKCPPKASLRDKSHAPTLQSSAMQVQNPYGSSNQQMRSDTSRQRRKQLQKELNNAKNQAEKADAERDMQAAAQSHSVMDMLDAGFRHGQANEKIEREAKRLDGESFGSGFQQVVLPALQQKALKELNQYLDGMDDGHGMDGPTANY